MMGNFYRGNQLNISGSDWEEILRHTKTEEQEGKEIWGKLQSKNLSCENLSDARGEIDKKEFEEKKKDLI